MNKNDTIKVYINKSNIINDTKKLNILKNKTYVFMNVIKIVLILLNGILTNKNIVIIILKQIKINLYWLILKKMDFIE